jgi:hypothetical protein
MAFDFSNINLNAWYAKIVGTLVILAMIGGAFYAYYERGVTIDTLNKAVTEKDKTIKDLKHTVDVDKKVEGITEDANVGIADDTNAANNKHTAIDDKTDKAIAAIEKKFKDKAAKEKATAEAMAADATAKDTAISMALISSVWEQYCSGKPACVVH